MAKATTPNPLDSKTTIGKKSTSDTIDINQRFEKPLFKRIQRFKDEIGASSEQEAIRIAMTIYLTKNGF
jgi:hypothetical protein